MLLHHYDLDICCGYAAAAIACIAFGSFAVPIKCDTVQKLNIDPLVLQTYKIVVFFITTMILVLLTDNIPFEFSFWGIISGLFMVPGGTAGYYAVQTSGLAISQGIWSSCKVLIAFIWGVLIFHEPIRNTAQTIIAIILMITGLTGMSYYATPSTTTTNNNNTTSNTDELPQTSINVYNTINNDDDNNDNNLEEPLLGQQDYEKQLSAISSDDIVQPKNSKTNNTTIDNNNNSNNKNKNKLWKWGIIGALIDGLYGGSILVPMHYYNATKNSTNLQQEQEHHGKNGFTFLSSFAIGCLIVVIFAWLIRFCYNFCCLLRVQEQQQSTTTKKLRNAFRTLPSFHFKTAGPYAFLAGFIWSVGNTCSIASVALLGQGVGYSIVQSQLLVAGLWGALWFREMQSKSYIYRWLFYACITLLSIVLISYQHQS